MGLRIYREILMGVSAVCEPYVNKLLLGEIFHKGNKKKQQKIKGGRVETSGTGNFFVAPFYKFFCAQSSHCFLRVAYQGCI
jgi:hypothetical protein